MARNKSYISQLNYLELIIVHASKGTLKKSLSVKNKEKSKGLTLRAEVG